MDNILQTLLADTYTVSSLRRRMRVLKTYLVDFIFKTDHKIDQTQFDAADLAYLKSLPPEFFKEFTPQTVYDVFSKVEKEITKLKVLTLYLTFDPDEQTLKQIGYHLRQNFKNIHLLDIKFDPNLIAGAAFVWNGVYKDYSLRAQIEAKKGLILESFKKYLR